MNFSRPTPKAEMNIIPFLDVLLVLLLILMVTTPVVQQSVRVELPQARDAKSSSTAAIPVILEISAPGCYALIIQGKRLENLPQQQVVMRSQQQVQQDAKSQFLIAGAAAVPYEEILKGLGLLHQAGITAVGLMTQPL